MEDLFQSKEMMTRRELSSYSSELEVNLITNLDRSLILKVVKLASDIYQDKVRACWMGKNIGGTLGAPFEGVDRLGQLAFFDPVPYEPMANDDLELQLVWLCIAEKHGLSLCSEHFASAWRDNIKYGMDEYGIAKWNLKRGLMPPLSGVHNNWFAKSIGAVIRSEIWASLFPGKPRVAAHFARLDASVDHAGEGVWAEMFMAAAESAAFIADNAEDALSEGLALIPENCLTAKVVRMVMELCKKEQDMQSIRKMILTDYGSHNFTDCVMNIGFIVLGLLIAKGDFATAILTAANCGMDADCTAATCGAFMGILNGTIGIENKWRSAISEKIAVSDFVTGLDFPHDIEQMTRRTVALADELEKNCESFIPCTSVKMEENFVDDAYKWLLFSHSGDPLKEPAIIASAQDNPGKFTDSLVSFSGINIDLSPYCSPPKSTIYLLTKLRVPFDVDGFLMLCADTGISAWLDGKNILNYYGRKPAIPAYHRVEGGASIGMKLQANRCYNLKIRLLFCYKPLTFTIAMLDMNGQYVPGFELIVE